MSKRFAFLILLAAVPAAAQVTVDSIAVTPASPIAGQEFAIDATLIYDNGGSTTDAFRFVEIGNGKIVLTALGIFSCPFECGPGAQTYHETIAGLSAGAYQIEIWNAFQMLGSQGFLVLPAEPPVPKVTVQDAREDAQTLLLVSGLESCSPPVVVDVVRAGTRLGITARDPVEDCAEPALQAFAIRLEPLVAGSYRADLEVETSPGHHQIGIRRDFVVAPSPDVLAFHDGRFHATATWLDFQGQAGVGLPIPGASEESGLFAFFDLANWEAMVKVLDGCLINGHYWALVSGATNVQYQVRIEDGERPDAPWSFDNPLGVFSPARIDLEAFPCD